MEQQQFQTRFRCAYHSVKSKACPRACSSGHVLRWLPQFFSAGGLRPSAVPVLSHLVGTLVSPAGRGPSSSQVCQPDHDGGGRHRTQGGLLHAPRDVFRPSMSLRGCCGHTLSEASGECFRHPGVLCS